MTCYELAPYVSAGFMDGILHFGFGSIQEKIEDQELQDIIIRAAHFWKSPHTKEEVKKYLKSCGFENEEKRGKAIDMLLQGNYLMESGLYDPGDRYSRHMLYFNLSGGNPAAVQERLANSHVIVLGCGGIGNFVSVILAAAGVGRLTLVDNDEIELSNLPRQILFTENDLHKMKIDVLKKNLLERNQNVDVFLLKNEIKRKDDLSCLPDADLIVMSADKPDQLIFWVNKFCVERGIPYINIGYVQDIAIWGPMVIPGKTGCFQCQSILANQKIDREELLTLLGEIRFSYQAPSSGPINALASGGALIDILKYLGGFGLIASLNRRIGIWTDDLRIEIQDCSRNPECKVCSHL